MTTTQHPKQQQPTLPSLGFRGTLRFIWNQLTSMRTALMLLLLLALAAVPGSLFPQRRAGEGIVDTWIEDNPTLGPILDALGMFDVYTSPWFSAVYLLLMVSLVGCVWPRGRQHLKSLRQPPARTPRNLNRLPEYGQLVLAADGPTPDQALVDAEKILKKAGYRTELRDGSVGAERGYTREIGNILFHFGLLGVIVFMGIGGLYKYEGQKIIVEGDGFTNNLTAYDSFTPGTAFSADRLHPFTIQLDDFEVVYDRDSETHFGQALDYTATMQVTPGPGEDTYQDAIKVNDPLTLGGVRIFLVGNGYAPNITVTDGNGDVAYSGPVIGQIQDTGVNTSQVVLKVPDARPEQLGFVGLFLPTSYTGDDGVAISIDPDAYNPELILNSYYGDIGLDSGLPQSVYVLDTDNMTELNSRNNDHGGITLGVGDTYELPDDMGSISFDSWDRYVGLDIHYNPSKWGVGFFATLALVALIISLYVRRRRAWVKATEHEGHTVIEYGLLARGETFGLRDENIKLRQTFDTTWPVIPPTTSEDS
ncbi:cytochrome c biogenesis protein ResB [Enteractinococcus helveticum]|uniref:Cytochrome C biogenesis protein ResB n=1 Tax=Enteractinococcus helveticum TaxID=1837282 RepID=A0A1B7LYJ0_9MICC|nr:cytochrome c biogenesis protein ResB [Enteractinococcus helveticum]OAV60484.1 cytochrome C biogenesis protein ResB [Enteractinococcus helveticum]